MKVRVPGVRKLRNMIERWNSLSTVTQVTSQCTTTNNSLKARTQHANQGGTMTKLGLLKSGKLMNWWMIERRNPVVGYWAKTREFQSSFSREHNHVIVEEEENHDRTGETRCLPSTRSTAIRHWGRRNRIRFCRWDPDHSWVGWMIKCGKDKNDLRWMSQKTTKNILWYGECSCL